MSLNEESHTRQNIQLLVKGYCETDILTLSAPGSGMFRLLKISPFHIPRVYFSCSIQQFVSVQLKEFVKESTATYLQPVTVKIS